MNIVTIEQSNHEILTTPAQWITFPLQETVKQAIHEMRHFIENLPSPFGKPAGMAATQLGFPYRIIFFQIPPEAKTIRKDVFDEIPLTMLINPSYRPLPHSKKCKDWEGCYSIPGLMGEVYRYFEIEYDAYNEAGEKMTVYAKGLHARIIQHEVGHINGELYTDLVTDDCRIGPIDEMLAIRKAEMAEYLKSEA